MKAIVFLGPEKTAVETVADPVIADPKDAIVRVRQSAVCGSDLHVYHGRERGLDIGTVMGHEFAGEIVETGSAVRNVHVGDRVGSPFSINCGRCFFCDTGLTARCVEGRISFGWMENGEGLQGGQAEYVRVPWADATLVKMPQTISWEEAVLLGDNLAAGYFCTDMADLRPGQVGVVIGCGAVGLLTVLAAGQRDASRLIAVDPLPFRRDLAKTMGATDAVSPEEALAVVKDASDGRGADAVLEAVGSLGAQKSAIELVRPGGVIAVVGVHTADHFAFSPTDAYNLNLTYKTGRCPARHYMERLIPFAEQNRDRIQKVISHRLPLHDGADAYRMFAERSERCIKVMLNPAE